VNRLALCLLLVTGCTEDFGSFSFMPKDRPEPEDAGFTMPEDDAGTPVITTMDAGGTVTTDAGGADTGVDSSLPDDDDAGSPPTACDEFTEATPVASKPNCAGCACTSCDAPIEQCFNSGEPAKDALCAAAVACALQNACQDYDCYCSSMPCGAPAATGDGPCVAEYNAAADGMKAQVNAIRTGNDSDEPLVRAKNVIECVLGLSDQSFNGPASGMCEADCM
jgi:hypothetical protein